MKNGMQRISEKCETVFWCDVKKRKTRATKDGRRGFLYTSCGPAANAFLPLRSIQAHADSAGQAGFASHKPLRFRPSGLQIPPVLASPKGPCAAPSQAPSVAARRRRYNTLDLAGKIVCQMERCPLWKPLPRNLPVSLDSSTQRKPEHLNHAPAFSAQRGASPLDSPCKRGSAPLFCNPPPRKPTRFPWILTFREKLL